MMKGIIMESKFILKKDPVIYEYVKGAVILFSFILIGSIIAYFA